MDQASNNYTEREILLLKKISDLEAKLKTYEND